MLHMYIYIYICGYIHRYIYIHVHMKIFIHTCMYTYSGVPVSAQELALAPPTHAKRARVRAGATSAHFRTRQEPRWRETGSVWREN